MSDEPAPAPASAPASGVPPALVVAIAVSLASGILIELLLTYASMLEGDPRRWGWLGQFLFAGRGLISAGTSFAVSTLMLVGLLELARRAGPALDGLALRVAAAMAAVMLLLALSRYYVNYWWYPRGEMDKEQFETLQEFYRWHYRVVFVAALTASAALVFAGRKHVTVLVTALPFLGFTALAFPTEQLYTWVSFDRPESKTQLWLQAAIDIWIHLGFAGTFMATVSTIGAALPPAPADMARAGQGLERAGSGLVARVIVLVVAAFTLVMTVGAQSPSMARVAGVIFPTCLLLASIAIVTGMLQAGGLSAAGAPRLRLYAGAAFSIIAMVIDALKAITLYVALRRGEDLDGFPGERLKQTAMVFPYLAPAIAIAGLLCTLSAAERLRKMTTGARVDAAAINGAAASVVIFTSCAVGLLQWAQSGVKSQGTFIVVSLFVALANIVAQLAVARVCHRVGYAMREVSALPTAVATLK